MNGDRALCTIRRSNEAQLAAFFGGIKRSLLVGGREILLVRHDPDLQQMAGVGRVPVEFTVEDTGAGGHALYVVRPNHFLVPHTILMREFTFQNVGDDLHILVRVHPETGTGGHPVFVDHA